MLVSEKMGQQGGVHQKVRVTSQALPSPDPIASIASALVQRTRAGTSLVQWLDSGLPLQDAQVPFLVGELRSSPGLCGKKEKKKKPGREQK